MLVLHAAPCASRAPVMYEPSSAGVTVAGSSVATMRPRRNTTSVSDSPISSSRSAETEQDGQAGGPGVAQVLPDVGLRADVDARGSGGRR